MLDPDDPPGTLLVLTGNVEGVTVRLAIDPECRLHGGAARAVKRHALRHVSVRQPPATPAAQPTR